MNDERQIAINPPRGSRILLITMPEHTSRQMLTYTAKVTSEKLAYLREHPDEALVVLVVTKDVDVRWLEAEAPEPMRNEAAEGGWRLPGENDTTPPRAPATLPHTRRPATKVTKGLGPARVRKTERAPP